MVPPTCYGVPKPNQRAGAHPAVPMERQGWEAGIEWWQCHVCGRYYLRWRERTDPALCTPCSPVYDGVVMRWDPALQGMPVRWHCRECAAGWVAGASVAYGWWLRLVHLAYAAVQAGLPHAQVLADLSEEAWAVCAAEHDNSPGGPRHQALLALRGGSQQ